VKHFQFFLLLTCARTLPLIAQSAGAGGGGGFLEKIF